jgi:hypothetical protein
MGGKGKGTPLYKSYTCSQEWLDFLIDTIADEPTWEKLISIGK